MVKKYRSKYYVDENIVRLVAALVFIIASFSLWEGWSIIFILLAADFALRGLTHLPSPLAVIAKMIIRPIKPEPRPIYAPPKKFAATIGFVFSLVIFVLLYLDYPIGGYIVGGVLVFFAFLESVFKICVGCRVYDWLVAPIANRREARAIKLQS